MTFNAALLREKAPENLRVEWMVVPEEGGPIGNFGASKIVSCCRFTLVGYEDDARPLIVLANGWIDQGLLSKEYEWFGGSPEQHQYHLHEARALGTWLEENELATNHWNEARRFLEAWWRNGVWTRQEIMRDGLDDYMAMAVLGGHFEDYKHGKEPFEAGIDMYEHWTGKSDVSLKKLLKPRELGYILCRHYLNNEFDRADVLAAGRKMLAANLSQPQPYCDGWLENGQSLRAAMWLMLVYWYPAFHNGEELPSPVDVLLKAYDDMPDVTRPF
jgi:hypothetical protein